MKYRIHDLRIQIDLRFKERVGVDGLDIPQGECRIAPFIAVRVRASLRERSGADGCERGLSADDQMTSRAGAP